MRWSLKLGSLFGIGIYVHFTFLILIVWLAYAHLASGHGLARTVEGVGFILAAFGCVLLHELGHALMAKRFGVPTRDITLWPIGGVARLERIPEVPMQEFWIAVAGPAVNVAIAGLLLGVLAVQGRMERIADVAIVGGPFLEKLLSINLMLVAFNLLPAFPMDGGRVLRALLARKMPRVRATHIAATVGQGMAMLFALGGLLSGNWMLLFIAFFVYTGAQAEAQAVEMRAIFQGVPVRDAMATRFTALDVRDTLDRATRELLAGHQQDFPLFDDGRIAGIAFRRDILAALAAGDSTRLLGEVMCRDCPKVEGSESLERAAQTMQESDCSTLLVTKGGELIGLLTSENLGEWAMIQSALRSRQSEAG